MPTRKPAATPRDPWSSAEYKQFRKDVSDIAEAAKEFAHLARFVRKYTAWMIAAASVLFPTVAHIVQQLPPLPH